MEQLLNIAAASGSSGAKKKGGVAAGGGGAPPMPGLEALGLGGMDAAQLKQQADSLWRMLDEMAESDPQAYTNFISQQAAAAAAAAGGGGQAGALGGGARAAGAVVTAWQAGKQAVHVHVWPAPPGAARAPFQPPACGLATLETQWHHVCCAAAGQAVPMPRVALGPVTPTTCAWQGLQVPCAKATPPQGWQPDAQLAAAAAASPGPPAWHLHCAVHPHALHLVGSGAPPAFRALFHEALCQWAEQQLGGGCTLDRAPPGAVAGKLQQAGQQRVLQVAPRYLPSKPAAPQKQAQPEVKLPVGGAGAGGGGVGTTQEESPTPPMLLPGGLQLPGAAKAGPPEAARGPRGPLIEELPAAAPSAAGASDAAAARPAQQAQDAAGEGSSSSGTEVVRVSVTPALGVQRAVERFPSWSRTQILCGVVVPMQVVRQGEGGKGSLTVEVRVGRAQRLRDIDLEFDEACAALLVGVAGGGAPARVPLPGQVDPDSCQATFSAKTKLLKVVAKLVATP